MAIVETLRAAALADQRHYDGLWHLTGCRKWHAKADWARNLAKAYGRMLAHA